MISYIKGLLSVSCLLFLLDGNFSHGAGLSVSFFGHFQQIEKSWKVNTGVLKLEPLSWTTTNTLPSTVAMPLSRPLFLKGELNKKMSNVSPFNTSK